MVTNAVRAAEVDSRATTATGPVVSKHDRWVRAKD